MEYMLYWWKYIYVQVHLGTNGLKAAMKTCYNRSDIVVHRKIEKLRKVQTVPETKSTSL